MKNLDLEKFRKRMGIISREKAPYMYSTEEQELGKDFLTLCDEVERLQKIVELYDNRLAPRNLELSIQVEDMKPVLEAAQHWYSSKDPSGKPEERLWNTVTKYRAIQMEQYARQSAEWRKQRGEV